MSKTNLFRANKKLSPKKVNDPADIFLTLMEGIKDGITGDIATEFRGEETQTQVCPGLSKNPVQKK